MEAEKAISELAVIHCLDQIKGFGPIKFRQIFEVYGSFSSFWEEVNNEAYDRFSQRLNFGAAFRKSFLKQLKLVSKKFEDCTSFIRNQVDRANKIRGELLTYSSNEYPRNLYRTNQCVPILYAAGNVDILKSEKCAAVVGTRKPSNWSKKETIAAVKELASQGYVIVSGLAMGTDAIAHESALDCNAKTVSVVGCGVDVYYPKENRKLQDKIKRKGVIVSEYPFGSRIKSISLQKRDKIIVGLSRNVLIVETSKTGGTMNAYRAAIEQKKPVGVFLPPPRIRENFDGNLSIIAEGKTKVLRFKGGSSVRFGESEIDQGFSF